MRKSCHPVRLGFERAWELYSEKFWLCIVFVDHEGALIILDATCSSITFSLNGIYALCARRPVENYPVTSRSCIMYYNVILDACLDSCSSTYRMVNLHLINLLIHFQHPSVPMCTYTNGDGSPSLT